MGLDMYLEKRTYVKRWEHKKDEEQFEVSVQRGGKPFPDIKPESVKSVVEELMYWRKANHIHAWFVDHCGNGNDDGREIYVSKESLQELLETCEKVIKASKLVKGKIYNGETYKDGKWVVNRLDGKVIGNPGMAQELLPTRSGFFFGCTEYDKYYLDEVVRTRDMLKEEFETPQTERTGLDYYYIASW
jgi:hypothetical protein